MSVSAIGGVVGSGSDVSTIQRSGLSEQDFINLFLTQLTFQDPLDPVDNREFLAQLAQFTTIQQTQTLNDNLMGALEMQASTQAVNLIGKTVEIQRNGQRLDGTITTVSFQNNQAVLTMQESNGDEITDVALSEIVLVRAGSQS